MYKPKTCIKLNEEITVKSRLEVAVLMIYKLAEIINEDKKKYKDIQERILECNNCQLFFIDDFKKHQCYDCGHDYCDDCYKRCLIKCQCNEHEDPPCQRSEFNQHRRCECDNYLCHDCAKKFVNDLVLCQRCLFADDSVE